MNPSRLIPILGIMICIVLGAMSFYLVNVISHAPNPKSNVLFTQEPTIASSQVSVFDTYIAPSDTPTPLDYGTLPITQTIVAVGAIEANSQATIAASKSTQLAVDRINHDATATTEVLATDVANAQATNDRTIRNQQAQEAQDKAKTTLALIFEYVWKVGGSVVLILAVCLGMIYKFHVEKLKANRKAVERVTANFLNNLSPITVQVSTDKHSGYQHTINITPAEMVVLRQAVTDLNGDLSRSKIVAGKYFPERRWNALDDELVKENADGVTFFERDSKGIHPTEAGYKFLGLKHPTPPLEEKSPEIVETPEIAVTSRHVTGVTSTENSTEKEML